MQINLTGFLNGKHARIFMGELWAMLDSAQKNENGIPQELLDLKVYPQQLWYKIRYRILFLIVMSSVVEPKPAGAGLFSWSRTF